MTSAHGIGNDDAVESTPLLSSRIREDVSITLETSHMKRRVDLLLCAFAFTMMLGDNLQPAALTQIFEGVICDNYYARHSYSPASNPSPLSMRQLADPCKVHAVQKELAQVRGFQQLVPLFPALVCTVPYGLLAERIGRKRVLILSGAGVFAALSWVLAVCYWRFVGIRWVWLTGAFLFIGGGDAVTSSIVHVMVTDTTGPAERAQIFLFLHAADVVSGFIGPAVSAALMEKGYTWTVLLLAEMALFSGTFLLTLHIPETLRFRDKSSDLTVDTVSPPVTVTSTQRFASSNPTQTANPFFDRVSRVLAPLLSVLTSNRRALLLLGIFAPQTAARDLFTMIGLQYSNARFALSYGRGNVLLSLFQGAQALVVLVLLPSITRLIADPRGWTNWARDRRYAIMSIAVTVSGLIVIAVAPGLVLEATGLLLVACGSCTTGLLMSLLGGAVRPSQVSAVYSAALMLSIVVSSITGPVANMLLVKGLVLGWNWMGLPFAAMAVLMAGVMVASTFISAEKGGNFEEE
jgi:MFS family permease